ncbi:MAG: glycoside hydrolase family 3 protein [Eubacterium sp.]|nr:glycoside hydrolase family 3 protein [Eubacterium sp.]
MKKYLINIKKMTGSVLVFSLFIISIAGCGAAGNNASDEPQVSEEAMVSAAPDTEDKDAEKDTAPEDEKNDEENSADGKGLRYQEYANMSADEIVRGLTPEQKAAQMVIPACYNTNEEQMQDNDYGSVLNRMPLDHEGWSAYVDGMQRAATESDAGVPFIYGQDDVHGVNAALNTVIFPHNIGIGAANDEELTYRMGQITADEALLCHMIWNYAPCLAQSVDPRWGRTYESYGSDLDMIKKLGTAYTKGLIDGGVIACPKHFFGDGNVEYGTGEKTETNMLIDRGNATLSDEQIDKLLAVYQAQIDAGAQTIMISHSALNGVKMHENKKYIEKLKKEMGFNGFIVSDWNSIQNTSPSTYYDQVVTAVNAGIDMLMEPDRYDEAIGIIVEAVENGDITEDRLNDAVTRILQVKLDAGVIADPFFEKVETKQQETGSDEYRDVAEKLVEKSQVLIKNKEGILPFKKGTKIYITGPAADDKNVQCGGWTIDWNESSIKDIPGVTTIEDGLEDAAEEYGLTIYDDEEDASKADVVLLVVGERSYAEWYGDAKNMDLCGDLGLEENADAMEEAKKLGKPIVTCIVAGRNVFIEKYINDWDAVVMSYLPGSEGQGVANVLCGGAEFTGRLPSPWYRDTKQIGSKRPWLKAGYGL